MSSEVDFEEVWNNIRLKKGETFETARDLKFTYSILGPWVVISGSDFRITKKNFLKAFNMMPVASPEKFSADIQGKYYVHAILSDPRIMY